MKNDIKFYDTSALLKMDYVPEDKILISKKGFELCSSIVPFLYTYIDRYEIIDSEYAFTRFNELQDAIFANDYLYTDEVIYVTAEQETAEAANQFFGSGMIELI